MLAGYSALQMFPGHGDGMGGWWGFGMILGVLFWVALIVLIGVVIWRLLEARGGRGEGGESALDILEERYARGEIDREEFEQKKRDLGRR